MSNQENFVTPKGAAYWAHVRTEETYQGKPTGKFSISVMFDKDTTDAMLKKLEAIYAELKKYAPCFKGNKPAKGSKPNFGTKTNAEGDILFKFTTQTVGKNQKTGETWEKVIPVFDKAGKHLEVNIGNGYCEN